MTTSFIYNISILFFLSLKNHQAWKDELLTWSPSDYGGIEEARVPVDWIWTPGIPNKLFQSLRISIFKSFKKKFNFLQDTFLYNAADSDSWNQWDVSSE